MFFIAFSRLELHKVNVTAMCGSVNLCVCVCARAVVCVCMHVCVLLQGAKLLQMSICRVHNPPEPTLTHAHVRRHTQKIHAITTCYHTHRHMHKCNLPQNLKHSVHTCTVFSLFQLYLDLFSFLQPFA